VQAFLQDRHLVDRGLSNYWGYNTLAFFAPEPRYLASRHGNEFKAFVKTFHAAGIEVILDVVYNHTAEGSELGPTLSFRGIDNASYYRLVPGNPRYYMDFTGCGNSFNLHHAQVLQLVMDSLRHWVEEMHVDGFRFDLAATLAREASGQFDVDSGFLDAIRQDPVLAKVKLIAEPGTSATAATASAVFRPGGRNGTTATATPCGDSGKATRVRSPSSPRASRVPATSSRTAAAGLGPPSTS
jgi:isoamylase